LQEYEVDEEQPSISRVLALVKRSRARDQWPKRVVGRIIGSMCFVAEWCRLD
jgi:hypothetical protein